MPANILFVVTSHCVLGGRETGWNLSEVAYPYHILNTLGHGITFVSPLGGRAPMDPGTEQAFKDDKICKEFLADAKAKNLIEHTKKPSEVNSNDFKAIYFPGGYGAMFDLPVNHDIAKIAIDIYEKGGIVSAVCHGAAGLVPLVLSSGEHLIKGKKVTSFSNFEEVEVGLEILNDMPFKLEDKLKELGGDFIKAHAWAENVQVDGRLITGQNQSSSTKLADELAKQLQS